MAKTVDLLSGGVAKTLLVFAAPLFLANLCQTLYNIVDLIIVGQFVGSEGLSGVSVGTDLTHFVLFLSMGLSTAGQVLISQRLGAKQDEEARVFAGTFFTASLVSASVITIVFVVGCTTALDLMNTPPEAYEAAYIYTLICMLGMPCVYLYNAISALFRAHGDSRRPLYFTLAASAVNLLLDLLLIVAWGWGVLGAAVATVVGQAVSFVGSAIYLYRNQETYGFPIALQSFKVEARCLKALVKLGVPMALQSASVSFSKVFVSAWINSYGLYVSAATGVAWRFGQFAHIYSASVSAASSVMIGHAIGARNGGRVKRIIITAFGIAATCSAAVLAFIAAFPEAPFLLFTTDPNVLSVCAEYLPILVLDFVLVAFRCPMLSTINGVGKPGLNLAVAIIDGPLVRMGLGVVLGWGFGMGYFGFWLGSSLAGSTPALVGGAYLAYLALTNRKLVPDE